MAISPCCWRWPRRRPGFPCCTPPPSARGRPASVMTALENGPALYNWYFMRKWRSSLRKRSSCSRRSSSTRRLVEDMRGLTDWLVQSTRPGGHRRVFRRLRVAAAARGTAVPVSVLPRPTTLYPRDHAAAAAAASHSSLDIAEHGGHAASSRALTCAASPSAGSREAGRRGARARRLTIQPAGSYSASCALAASECAPRSCLDPASSARRWA